MERVRFEYEVVAVLRFTRDEVTRLSKTCEHHYDATVKSLSIPGKNAVLNAARNHMDPAGTQTDCDVAEVPVTLRQLDLLCKATEMPMDNGLDLHMKLRELLREAIAETARLNRSDEA